MVGMAQGGTCIICGDQYQLLLQAAEIAEQAIGCQVVFGATFPFEEGYNRERFNSLDAQARWVPGILPATAFSYGAVSCPLTVNQGCGLACRAAERC
jgi:hypothetical protein